MTDYISTNLSSVLNSNPEEQWHQAYGKDMDAIAFFGGPQLAKPKAGRFQWTLLTDPNSAVGPFSSSTDWTTADTTGRGKVTAEPRGYHARVIVNARDVAMADGGAYDNLGMPDYITQELAESLDAMWDVFNTDIQVASTNNFAIESLPDALATPTGSGNFYDVARSGNAWANATAVSASDGTKITKALLETADNDMKKRKARYNTILVSTANYKRLEDQLFPSGSIVRDQNLEVGNYGFASLKFRKANIIEFNQLSDDAIYLVNRDETEIWYEPQTWVDSNDGTIKSDGMFLTERRAGTADNYIYIVWAYLQFVVKNPFNCGVIYNLTTP